MIIITPNRLKNMLTDCRTEADVAATLRYHKVKFRYSTDCGFTSIIVPCSSGSVRIYRTASKVAPIVIGSIAPAPYARPTHITRRDTI